MIFKTMTIVTILIIMIKLIMIINKDDENNVIR